MTLTLELRAATSIPLEVAGIVPDRLRERSLDEIERLEVFHGNQKRPLAEFFKVTGDAGDQRIEWLGDLASVHLIGAKMAAGQVYVLGNAGRHVGSEMHGGEIHVAGNAGDWLGGEMHGGLIRVRGRAGQLVASAYRGSRRGMTGGTVLVEGVVGDELGHTLRRGLVAVGGCGDFCGINMIAGTILVFGPAGERTGAGMRRGTIGLFGPQPAQLLPTFARGGRDKLLMLTLVFRELSRLGYPYDPGLRDRAYRLYHGDLVTAAAGEILLPEG
jgi:formylmethanofuran dehydrogenase subunit C